MKNFEVIILGSGAAGLTVALELADLGKKVALLTKKDLLSGSTAYAQGGISAVIDQNDKFEFHIQDTYVAGDCYGDLDVIKYVVSNAPKAIEWLQNQGMNFTLEDGKLHLTREGGHSCRRILHTRDITGRELANTLIRRIKSTKITILTNWVGVDLIVEGKRCCGVKYFNLNEGTYGEVRSDFVVLATGGTNRIYPVITSNTDNYGAGIAMAVRAGVKIRNMEFHQFHPTSFFRYPFLISEAVRGEGGYLSVNGKSFMNKYDERGDLAPRDIVTRAIVRELELNDREYVDLNLNKISEVNKRFPEIYNFCYKHGLDIREHSIPVVPAAHYVCGGVVTNLSGETSLSNLFAVGEVACTGLHGANRLASNSLIECIVFGLAVSKEILRRLKPTGNLVEIKSFGKLLDGRSNSFDIELPKLMWKKAGIIRKTKNLEEMLVWINERESDWNIDTLSLRQQETRNLFTVAKLIVGSALNQKRNCGCHFNIDLI